jgi:hypothetical protein
MVEVLFGVLMQGLKLWNNKESTKYLDEVIKLQQDYLNEYNKPRGSRNNNDLDNIELRLELLSKNFITAAGKKDA